MAKNRRKKQSKNNKKNTPKQTQAKVTQAVETKAVEVKETVVDKPVKKAEPKVNRREEIRAGKLAAEYGYVGKELRMIGILAAGLFALLVVLNLVL